MSHWRATYRSLVQLGWQIAFHDFWCQVAIVALLQHAHRHTESEHNEWPELEEWWTWFKRDPIIGVGELAS